MSVTCPGCGYDVETLLPDPVRGWPQQGNPNADVCRSCLDVGDWLAKKPLSEWPSTFDEDGKPIPAQEWTRLVMRLMRKGNQPDTPGTIRDVNTGEKLATTDSLEETFLAEVRRHLAAGDCYVVIGTDQPDGFRERILAAGVELVDEPSLGDAAIILEGRASDHQPLD